MQGLTMVEVTSTLLVTIRASSKGCNSELPASYHQGWQQGCDSELPASYYLGTAMIDRAAREEAAEGLYRECG